MGGLELAKMADFCADLTSRFALTDSLALWRDISERLHQLATEPEDVTYREATANGVPALWVIPAGSSSEHVLLHSHSGGSVVANLPSCPGAHRVTCGPQIPSPPPAFTGCGGRAPNPGR
jgi:epsilon-lactone hydrolase